MRIDSTLRILTSLCLLVGLWVGLVPTDRLTVPHSPVSGNYFAINEASNAKTTNTTVNQHMQSIVMKALEHDSHIAKFTSGSAVILDAQNGDIKAISSLVSKDHFANCQSSWCHQKLTHLVSQGTWEPGSIIKPLTVAAGLDMQTITPDSSYYEPGVAYVQGRSIVNVYNYPSRVVAIPEILERSLNTGAVQVLRSFHNNSLDQETRTKWHTYLTDRYHFDGPYSYIANPINSPAVEYRYATSAFGIGITVTPLQMAAAYAALCNGGVYYEPRLSSPIKNTKGVRVLTPQTSQEMIALLQQVLTVNNSAALRTGYVLGGKSGTAPIAQGNGTYIAGKDSGSYIGYLSKNGTTYIILVRLDEPQVSGVASVEAAKVWAAITNKIIDSKLIQ